RRRAPIRIGSGGGWAPSTRPNRPIPPRSRSGGGAGPTSGGRPGCGAGGVREVAPACSDEQLSAARAHHLRRWAIPRDDYPRDRAGYLRWRTALRRQHAEDGAGIMRDAGYDDEAIARVQAIVRKQGLGRDPAVQVHEDALCLVFLETQFDELAGQLRDDEKMVDILRKTAGKMSPAGLEAAQGLAYSPGGAALLQRALAPA